MGNLSRTEIILDRFLQLLPFGLPASTVDELHPNDEERFVMFTQHSHQFRSGLAPEGLRQKMNELGFKEKFTEDLVEKHRYGRTLLACRHSPWNRSDSKSDANAERNDFVRTGISTWPRETDG